MSNALTTPHILWIDPGAQNQKIQPLILGSGAEMRLDCVDSAAKAKSLLEHKQFSIVVCDLELPDDSGIALLEHVKLRQPAVTRILASSVTSGEVLGDAVNRAAVFRILIKPWTEKDLKSCIGAALENHRESVKRQHLAKEIREQNRKLEELTRDLEFTVNERTRSIELSKLEVEKKSTRARTLVHFVTELARVAGLDELLALLRRELRRFHQVSDPTVCFWGPDLKPTVLSYRASQLVETHPSALWPQLETVRINNPIDQAYLANHLGRPFQRVIAIPLVGAQVAQDDSFAGRSQTPIVFVEHNLNDRQIERFLDFLSERLQPISLAFDRLVVEAQMRLSSMQWESTFDGLSDPIAIVDVDYRLTRANRKFSERSERGAQCHLVFNERSSPCDGCPIPLAVSTKQSQIGQIKRHGRFYSVYSYPIRLKGDDSPTNFINYYADITDQRLLYSRMIQNEKMAAIGLMAGNIAHELNNPLTGIRSLAQILGAELKSDPKYSGVASDLDEIERAAGRSEAIIRNLLDFSRQRTSEDKVKISLNDLVTKTLPLLKTAMHAHSNELDLADEAIPVKVDPQLLQQAIFNLVNNACQAMPETGGTLTLRTRRLQTEGFAELTVTDTGIGIKPDIMDRIFDPFFTTKVEGQGTGLGLSVTRSIIEQFGGRIEVQSSVGQGTQFRILLPLEENG